MDFTSWAAAFSFLFFALSQARSQDSNIFVSALHRAFKRASDFRIRRLLDSLRLPPCPSAIGYPGAALWLLSQPSRFAIFAPRFPVVSVHVIYYKRVSGFALLLHIQSQNWTATIPAVAYVFENLVTGKTGGRGNVAAAAAATAATSDSSMLDDDRYAYKKTRSTTTSRAYSKLQLRMYA